MSVDSLGSASVGCLSGLEVTLPPAESLEERFLDLKTSLSRAAGDGDLLPGWDTGGTSPEASVDTVGSNSPTLSVVDEYCEDREPW